MVASTTNARARQRIVFCIRAALPGRCGVTDYSIRMACAFRHIGWDAVILHGAGESGRTTIDTSEGSVEILPMDGFDFMASDVLSVQFVPSHTRGHWSWIGKITKLKASSTHLMMHEFWRVATPTVPLDFREKLRAIPQRIQCEWLRAKLKPEVITTSCGFYQQTLANAGWHASLSPMPGNIPTNTEGRTPAQLKNTAWFHPGRSHFTWMSFGSIYARYWDPGAYFLECRKLADLGIHTPKWVVAGRQSPKDVEVLLRCAERSGFPNDIELLGACEPAEVDWLMRHADAQVTGVSANCWDKSGGVLAARERNLPVFAPVDGLSELGDFLANPARHTAQVVATNGLNPQVAAIGSASILASMLLNRLSPAAITHASS